MNPYVFREYDVRGVAEIEGLRDTGADVIDLGVVPTPALYYALHHLHADGGVQVTGSHNPPEDNGFGRDVLRTHPGAVIVGEVKCSQALFDELARAGARPLMGPAGHSLIKARMRETGAVLAGELTGHIFFADRYPGFDDGIYAGARLLELLSRSSATLAALCDRLPVMVNTPEIRVACVAAHERDAVASALARLRARPDVRGVIEIDGARVDFGDGWGLVRASNTQPALVLRCEAASAERLSFIRCVLEAEVAHAAAAVATHVPPQEGTA